MCIYGYVEHCTFTVLMIRYVALSVPFVINNRNNNTLLLTRSCNVLNRVKHVINVSCLKEQTLIHNNTRLYFTRNYLEVNNLAFPDAGINNTHIRVVI